jgi:hypothetical protein
MTAITYPRAVAEFLAERGTPVCEAPEFRLRDIRRVAVLCARCDAVEEVLQLRHDIDDHAVALTLLRGHRPDLDETEIEGAMIELLGLAAQVRRLDSDSHDRWHAAVDRYEAQLHAFTHGGAR